MEFEFSKITVPFKKTKISNPKKSTHVGTTVSFIPDDTIFGEKAKFNIEDIRKRIDLKCYLNAGLKIILTIDGKPETFKHDNGIVDYLRIKVTNPLYNMDSIYINQKDEDGNEYEISLEYNNDTEENIIGFVNSLPLPDGGTHETGFKKGLTQVILDYIKNNGLLSGKDKDLNIRGEDIRRGLVCIISLKHDSPLYEGQTKAKLTNTDVDPKIRKIVVDNLSEWLAKNPKLAKALCDRIIAFAKATNSAKEKMKKIVTVNQSSAGLEITEKFMDCDSDDPDEAEIFIIEGNSAKGIAEKGRDFRFQAIYPLRGKILNTEGATAERIMENKELNEFLKIEFGTNDLKKIREGLRAIINGEEPVGIVIKSKKIIVLTDADSDGSHIEMLFINFIYEHIPEMIELGWIYIGSAPLFRVNVKGTFQYYRDENEYNEFVASIISEKYKVLNKDYSVKKLMYSYEEFKGEFERLREKYSIHNDTLSLVYSEEDYTTIKKRLKSEFGFKSYKSGTIEGLYNSVWHSFNLEDLFNEIQYLRTIYEGLYELKFKDLSTNEKFTMSLYDGLITMRKCFRYSRNRLKGKAYARCNGDITSRYYLKGGTLKII